MKRNPLISIVVPIYNVEKYLRQCLDSIVNQTYKNIEIILVEDCSKDRSLKIAKEYKEKYSRLILLENKENKGVSYSRNRAIKEAKGDYIVFIDSDDWINEIFIEELYKSFSQDVLCVVSEIVCCNNKTKELYSDLHNSHFHFIGYNKSKKINKQVIFNNLAPFDFGPYKMWKLKDIRDNYLKFQDNVSFEDLLFNIQSLLSIKKQYIFFNHNATYYYRNNISSVTTNYIKIRDIFIILKEIKESFININLYDQYKSSIEYFLCYIIHFWGFVTKKGKLNKDIKYFQLANKFINKYIDKNFFEKDLINLDSCIYKRLQFIKNNNYKKVYYYFFLREKKKVFLYIVKIIILLIFPSNIIKRIFQLFKR